MHYNLNGALYVSIITTFHNVACMYDILKRHYIPLNLQLDCSMSDEEFYSDEEYEFEFEEDQEEQDEVEVEEYGVENKYYTAKNIKYDNPEKAIALYLDISTDDSEWSFKSNKQIMKIYYNQKNYEKVLYYLKSALNQSHLSNNIEDSLTKIVNNYTGPLDFIDSLYIEILSFANANELHRLWLKIMIKKLEKEIENPLVWVSLLDTIKQRLSLLSDSVISSVSLELLSISISFYTRNFDLDKLTQLYRESKLVSSAVTHPKISGIILECGAKVDFYRGNFENSRLKFYSAFNKFDEIGSDEKKTVLKYLILTSILSELEFNPFDSQETNAYSSEEEFDLIIQLFNSYKNVDLIEFKQIFHLMSNSSDDFFRNDDIFAKSLPKMISNLKAKAIINYLKAFNSLTFDFLQRKVEISESELTQILLKLINNGKIQNRKLNFVNNTICSPDHFIKSESKDSDEKMGVSEKEKSSSSTSIQISNGKSQSNAFFPPITPQEIYKNLKSLDCIGGILPIKNQPKIDHSIKHNNLLKLNISLENGDSFTVQLSKDSVFLKLLFIVDYPTRTKNWDKLILQFQIMLSNSIPKPIKSLKSQMDQIYLIQKNQEEMGNQNIISNDINVEEIEEDVYKVDLLNTWSNEISSKLNSLIETR